ncbi:MAG: MBL fold metallo-hydrolase [Bacilli bacterium]|nr:MBL fold metallo-hydrolase [Bacilli bacterium]
MSTNILMLQNGNEALLIDTGYRRHFQKISQKLTKDNIQLKTVVVSHFHPDHTGGLTKSNHVEIIGSSNAEITLKKFHENYDHLLPTRLIDENYHLKYGNHSLTLIPNKGHSIDGMLIVIDDEYLFVGDDLIYTDEFDCVLPFCADHFIENHIQSLQLIKSYKDNKVIIPSHGRILMDETFVTIDIENRLIYLNYILKNKEKSFIDFEQETGITFFGKESHLYNIK